MDVIHTKSNLPAAREPQCLSNKSRESLRTKNRSTAWAQKRACPTYCYACVRMRDRGLQNRSYVLAFPRKCGKEKLANPAAFTGIKKIQHHPYICILTGNFFDFFQRHLM